MLEEFIFDRFVTRIGSSAFEQQLVLLEDEDEFGEGDDQGGGFTG